MMPRRKERVISGTSKVGAEEPKVASVEEDRRTEKMSSREWTPSGTRWTR